MPGYKVYKRLRLKARIIGLESHLFTLFAGSGFLVLLLLIAFNFSFKSIVAGGILLGVIYGSMTLLQNSNIHEFLRGLPKIISK